MKNYQRYTTSSMLSYRLNIVSSVCHINLWSGVTVLLCWIYIHNNVWSQMRTAYVVGSVSDTLLVLFATNISTLL